MVQGLTRLPNWRARFASEMNRQRGAAFSWGSQDCALGLASASVEAITGEDLARGWRGKYRGPVAAMRALKAAGYDSVAALVADKLPEVHPAYARIGDIGLISSDGPFGEALGVVDHAGLIVMTDDGHGIVPREQMTKAFKVG